MSYFVCGVTLSMVLVVAVSMAPAAVGIVRRRRGAGDGRDAPVASEDGA